MDIHFIEVTKQDQQKLVDFLSGSPWPFHGRNQETEQSVMGKIRGGLFGGLDVEAFWILGQEDKPLGLIRLFELEDPTPLFDLRLAEAARGKGIGRKALTWLADHFFRKHADKHRLGGYTRADNLAMQGVFIACGWQKEAHHRQAWPGDKGQWFDTMGYALLREEWANTNSTPNTKPGGGTL